MNRKNTGKKWPALLMGAGALLLGTLLGCSDNSVEALKVKLVVSATRSAQDAVSDIEDALRAQGALDKTVATQLAQATGSPLRMWQSYSFTPSALKIDLHNVIVFSEWTQNADEEWIGGGQEINMEVHKSIDLMSAAALDELYAQQFSIGEENFGSYIGAKLLLSDTVLVSGTVTVNGSEFVLQDVPVHIGFSGSHLEFTDTLVIQDSVAVPTLRLIVETENVAYLLRVEEGSGEYSRPALEDGETRLALANMVVLPYVGTGLPKIEKYGLTVDDDTTYALKVLVVENAQGKVVAAAIQPVYFQGFAPNGFPENVIDPAAWTMPILTENDNNISVNMNVEFYDEGASDRFVSFSAFERADHSGTLQLGYPASTDRSYTAVRYQTVE